MNKEIQELIKDATTPMEKITLIGIHFDSKTQELLNNIERGDMMPTETAHVISSTFYMNFWSSLKSIPHLYTLHNPSHRNKQLQELDSIRYTLHEELHEEVFKYCEDID